MNSASGLFFVAFFSHFVQDVPNFPHVEYRQPQAANISSTYECFGSDVRLDILSSDDGLTLTAFQNGSGKATAEQLEQWNAWLDGMSLYRAHWIGCQSNDQQSVMISGEKSGELGSRELTVWWQGDRMGAVSRIDRLPGNIIRRLPTD